MLGSHNHEPRPAGSKMHLIRVVGSSACMAPFLTRKLKSHRLGVLVKTNRLDWYPRSALKYQNRSEKTCTLRHSMLPVLRLAELHQPTPARS